MVLKRLVCIYRENRYCTGCQIQQKCAYGIIAEASPPGGSEALSKNINIPRPFIIHPPILEKPEIEAGRILDFSVVLVGSAIPFWPYIFQSIRALGDEGMGPQRTRFDVISASLENPASGESAEIYSFDGNILKNIETAVSMDELEKANPFNDKRKISLHFVSPTVIKSDGKIVRKPGFSHFIKRLRDRLNTLGTFFGKGSLIDDCCGLAEMAEEIKWDNSGIYWFDHSRFSTRSRTRHKTGGFMGIMNLRGNLKPFWKYLLLGQYVNVGKQVSFGNGRYIIIDSLA